MRSFLPRKFIDLIHQTCSKWANWDAAISIQVGAYGTVDQDTGELIIEGNFYDATFQQQLNKHNVSIKMSDFLPMEAPAEDDFIVSSRGVKRGDVDNVDAPGIANAPIKGKWFFQRGKRGAVLIMHSPRQISIPHNIVLRHLYKVDSLMSKWLVTSIHVCPAYSMYLSDKSGEKVSFALVPLHMTTAGPEMQGHGGGFTWRFFRDRIMPEPEGDELRYDGCPPWDPLDEDGEEDPFEPEVRAVDPFAAVDRAAAEKAAADLAAATVAVHFEES